MELRRYGTSITLETRSESYEQLDTEKRKQLIIKVLEENPMGLTAREIAEELCKQNYIPINERNCTAPRLTELSKSGVVEPIGKVVCNYTGRKVSVYKLRTN